MNNFIELEYKYKADNISLEDFIDFCNFISLVKSSFAEDKTSYDYYFTKSNNCDSFIRFRDSDLPELTKKIKTDKNNNWRRIEIDLPLDKKRVNFNTVENFLKLENYYLNFSIKKACYCFILDFYNYTYYTIYDETGKENSFIEIEINKNKLSELTDPVKTLDEVEQTLEYFNLTKSKLFHKY